MVILDIVDTLSLCVLSLECFRVLQACSYRPQRGYLKIFASKYFVVLVVTQAICLICHYFTYQWCVTVCLATTALLSRFVKRRCPLKFTKRIVRMITTQALALFCACYLVGGVYFVMALPLVTLLSWFICLPIDLLIAKHYLTKAANKLSKCDVTVIAVTGSYGKTCTKDMLTTLLDGAVSPTGSCNTPLGIAKFVNETNLSHCKYLVLEFGARKVGDIKQLCKLFAPQYGIVTGACEQHLSTFKSIGNIVKTKGELVSSLPADGACVLNSSDKHASQFFQLGICRKIITNTSCITDVKMSLDGMSFVYSLADKKHLVKLPQISNYIVDTFLMCCEMCNVVGQANAVTLQNCAYIKQTTHRMQVIHNGSFYIVDDAYNANVKGVENCCQTLSHFDNYKIAVTQGIVECGSKYKQFNEHCGKVLGKTFDVVITVGKYAKYIANGAQNFAKQVVIAGSLAEGTKLLQHYVRQNCIVLFQNDLPDVVSL